VVSSFFIKLLFLIPSLINIKWGKTVRGGRDHMIDRQRGRRRRRGDGPQRAILTDIEEDIEIEDRSLEMRERKSPKKRKFRMKNPSKSTNYLKWKK
jgi:hypothetical protein